MLPPASLVPHVSTFASKKFEKTFHRDLIKRELDNRFEIDQETLSFALN
jgi:hypothetical protein